MTSHPSVDQLSDWIDNFVGTAEHAATQRHLVTCAECAALADQLAMARDRASEIRIPAPSASPGIQARFQRWINGAPVPRRLIRPALWAVRWQLAGGAILCAIIGGFAAGQITTPAATKGPKASVPLTPGALDSAMVISGPFTLPAAVRERELLGRIALQAQNRLQMLRKVEDSIPELRHRIAALRDTAALGGPRAASAEQQLRMLFEDRLLQLEALMFGTVMEPGP